MVNGSPGTTIYAVTGHRPDKLGGYDAMTWARLCGFAAVTMKSFKPGLVITGMGQGWDLAVAAACVTLEVPFIAAIPFRGQERVWPQATQKLYGRLCAASAEFHVISGGGYEPWKMQRRNEWMVDKTSDLIALFNGESQGGTFRCVDYALRKGKNVHNVWDSWAAGYAR